MSQETPQKILIIRLSAIGDIVMAAPVARALKSAYPNAEIHWLAQPECLSLVADEPCIDKTIPWPRKQWGELWKQKQFAKYFKTVGEFKRTLRSEHYDLAVDLQGLLKSGLLAKLSGAKKKLGLGSREGSQWFMDEVIPRNLGNQDLIGSEYRTMIEKISGSNDYTLKLAVNDQNDRKAAVVLEQHGVKSRFIALCPFTTRPQKHWIDTHWQSLMDDLLALGHNLVVLGGPADSDYAQRLIGERPIHNLAGKTNLQQAGAVIAKSEAVIGVDTGLTHMGHAAHVPTVAIFGSTRPYLDAEREQSQIIYRDRACAPCKRRPTCDNRFDCMVDIRPSQVLATLQQAMSAQ